MQKSILRFWRGWEKGGGRGKRGRKKYYWRSNEGYIDTVISRKCLAKKQQHTTHVAIENGVSCILMRENELIVLNSVLETNVT